MLKPDLTDSLQMSEFRGLTNFIFLKKLVLYIFLFTMLLRICYAQIHYVFYLSDKAGYLELFCENQNKPSMHCEGKCSLNKVSKETTDKKDKIQDYIRSITFPDFIPTEKLNLYFSISICLNKEKVLAKPLLYFFLYLNPLKHPPERLMC